MTGTSCDSEDHNYQIRPPVQDDAQAFRMLLPTVQGASLRLVTVAGSEERVVAAAALTQSMRAKPPMGPGIDVHVIPPWRRRGIGSRMVAELQQTASAMGAEAMFAVQKVEAGTDAERGWRWLGFGPLETVIYHELELQTLEPRLAPLHQWMEQNGWVPSDARIVPLCDADRPAVARLHRQLLGGSYDLLLQKMHGDGPHAYHPTYSRVLLLGDEVKGCILAHRESQELAVVDANFLEPSVRGGWANIWLKLEATRGAAELGIKRFVYSTFDHYTDTRAFSEKLGGKEIKRMLLMHRLLGAAVAG